MKYFNAIKNLALSSFIGVASLANAQTAHPLNFGPVGTSTVSNWYKNYVGVRFEVTQPAAIAGDKIFTVAKDGSGATGMWGAADTTILMDTVIIGPTADTNGCAAYPAGFFTGKIALIWRGTCEFGAKALAAQTAGAIGVVIVNNVAGGPVGMGAGASGASVTIPVFMISLADGTAMVNELNEGITVVLNINPRWLSGQANDLGFVPSGYSLSAANAMPWNQWAAHPAAYKGLSGAFVANYGTHNATNVKLSSTLSWTPTGGTATAVHSDSVSLAAFPTSDSVWAMYAPQYDMAAVTGTGKWDLTYHITSDSTDGFPGDNTLTYSFYATDSIYCKGQYDFSRNRPVSGLYTAPGSTTPDFFTWGVPYYVATGGSVIDSVKFSVVNGTGLLPAGDQEVIYVFKWVDTVFNDSLMENAELQLIGQGSRTFGGSDSAFQTYSVYISGDTTNQGFDQVFTESNTWYLIAAQSQPNYALGCDGVLDGYPRTYGRKHFPGNNYSEYYNPIWFGDRNSSTTNMVGNPNTIWNPISFNGTGSLDVDSVCYSTQKGLIPALSMSTTSHVSGVKNVKSIFNNVSVYPNPASDNVNFEVSLDAVAKQVTYNVIDNMGRHIATEKHFNVQNDSYQYNTNKLPSGNYYIVISADGQFMILKMA